MPLRGRRLRLLPLLLLLLLLLLDLLDLLLPQHLPPGLALGWKQRRPSLPCLLPQLHPAATR